MELFVEIIFRWLIVRVLGMYTRWGFFWLIGNKKSMKELSGGKKANQVSHDFYNALVGLISFCSIAISIAYIIFSN